MTRTNGSQTNNVTDFDYWMQQVASKSMTRLQARDLRWFSSASSVYIHQMILRQTKMEHASYQSTIFIWISGLIAATYCE